MSIPSKALGFRLPRAPAGRPGGAAGARLHVHPHAVGAPAHAAVCGGGEGLQLRWGGLVRGLGGAPGQEGLRVPGATGICLRALLPGAFPDQDPVAPVQMGRPQEPLASLSGEAAWPLRTQVSLWVSRKLVRPGRPAPLSGDLSSLPCELRQVTSPLGGFRPAQGS